MRRAKRLGRRAVRHAIKAGLLKAHALKAMRRHRGGGGGGGGGIGGVLNGIISTVGPILGGLGL